MDNTREWIDITVPPHPDIFHWLEGLPGDGDTRQPIKGGEDAKTSAGRRRAFAGTHVEAPMHVLHGERDDAHMPFSAIIGLAKVIEIQDRKSVKVEELKKHRIFAKERILLKTRNSAPPWDSNPRREELIHLDPSAAYWLAERRITTIGIDALISGENNKKPQQTYAILQEAGIWIIQGLDLRLVKSGEYMMICLPLKARSGDGGPARAILQRVH